MLGRRRRQRRRRQALEALGGATAELLRTGITTVCPAAVLLACKQHREAGASRGGATAGAQGWRDRLFGGIHDAVLTVVASLVVHRCRLQGAPARSLLHAWAVLQVKQMGSNATKA